MKKGVMILVFLLVLPLISAPLKSTGATEPSQVEIDPFVLERLKNQTELIRKQTPSNPKISHFQPF